MEKEFEGVFGAAERERLRMRRMMLGMSLYGLASQLGVHWTTLWKWEQGMISQVQPRHRRIVAQFLNGDGLPQERSAARRLDHSDSPATDSPQLRNCLRNFCATCRILADAPHLQAQLVEQALETVNRLLARLLTAELPTEVIAPSPEMQMYSPMRLEKSCRGSDEA